MIIFLRYLFLFVIIASVEGYMYKNKYIWKSDLHILSKQFQIVVL